MNIKFVTWNIWKFNEVNSIININNSNINLIMEDIDLIEIQTNDIFEISQNKAIQAYNKLNSPIIVDDTWVYFNEYKDFPWVFAKYIYNSLWKKWFKRLLDWNSVKNWYMKTVISYMDSNLDYPISFSWEANWLFDFSYIDNIPENSLPYNFIFVPDWMKTTVVNDYENWISNFSQRLIATKNLIEYLNSNKKSSL